MELKQERFYTEQEYENMEYDGLMEYDHGVILMSPAPTPAHQRVVSELNIEIGSFLRGKPCTIYPSPFDVRLQFNHGVKRVQPDLSIICDKSKITPKGCEGAPDFIIEVISPATKSHDYLTKLKWYEEAGVREYWVVNHDKKIVTVYLLEKGDIEQYTFNDIVPVAIWNGDLSIDFNKLDFS